MLFLSKELIHWHWDEWRRSISGGGRVQTLGRASCQGSPGTVLLSGPECGAAPRKVCRGCVMLLKVFFRLKATEQMFVERLALTFVQEHYWTFSRCFRVFAYFLGGICRCLFCKQALCEVCFNMFHLILGQIQQRHATVCCTVLESVKIGSSALTLQENLTKGASSGGFHTYLDSREGFGCFSWFLAYNEALAQP